MARHTIIDGDIPSLRGQGVEIGRSEALVACLLNGAVKSGAVPEIETDPSAVARRSPLQRPFPRELAGLT